MIDRAHSKLIVSLIAIAAFAASAICQLPATPDVSAKLDEYMNAVWKIKGVGGSVLVVRGGKILVERGYGHADAARKVPNDPKLRYRIGSLTKQFTAAAILLLQEKGKLSVQDNACKYLDNCPETWKPITIHHLLTHTAGIPNVTALPDWPQRKLEDLSTVQVADLVRAMPLRFEPGSDFEYSNTGYILLGLVIEKASGRAYAEFMRSSIFAPLKLNDTGYDNVKRPAQNFAEGYTKRGSENVLADEINMKTPFAAGALYSTVGDLLRWSEALNSNRLLSQKSLDAMFRPEKRNYAYGWGVSSLNGRSIQSHTGGIDGFSSYIVRVPAEDIVVIVLLNNTAGMANVVGNDLLAIVTGDRYELPRERKEISLDPKQIDVFAGRYEVAPGLAFMVSVDAGRLMFLPPGQPRPVELFPEADTQFFLKVVDAQIQFVKDQAGRITGLEFRQAGRTTRARRVD